MEIIIKLVIIISSTVDGTNAAVEILDGATQTIVDQDTMDMMTAVNHHVVVNMTNMMTDVEAETIDEHGTITNHDDRLDFFM